MKITIVIEHEGVPCTDEMAKKALVQLDYAVSDIMTKEVIKEGRILLRQSNEFITTILEVKP